MVDTALPGNRLGACASPYLQQHAANPVAWQPWDEQALDLARSLDRPILLSIGYAACHWCHVMAHESFADPAIAEVMNRLYVPIKVDREERPDLDQIYQLAHQLMNRRGGGWPLTAFLTPETKPFFIATYFPDRPKFGMPGFKDVLEKVAAFYHDDRTGADQNGEAVTAGLASLVPAGAETLDGQVVTRMRGELDGDYDRAHGGWGSAPKFPHAGDIAFCLRRARLDGDSGARRMALDSLRAMVDGGLYDHLGGGFFRYATDADWTIPHFEKMLYDNAQLLGVLADGYASSGDPALRDAGEATVAWLDREMRHPDGGFYATLDADSEGVEGGYYLWDNNELTRQLDESELAVVERVYGASPGGNFAGKNHLRRVRSDAEIARELSWEPAQVRARLDTARDKLFAARQQRPFVGRDDKVLTGWNGLLIGALARAARAFDAPRCTTLAQGAVDFIRGHLFDGERLLAVAKGGARYQPAYLDDHAFLLTGLLELLQNQWRDSDLTLATDVAEALLRHFEDRENGGFFLTGDDQERLIHRPKPGMDQSLPSGNGAAARGLLALGHLLGEPRYLTAAEHTLRLFMPEMKAHPGAHGALVIATEEALQPPTLVLLRGGADATAWQQCIQQGFQPDRRVYAIPDNATLPAGLAERTNRADVTAYLCHGTECAAPITDWAALEGALAST